MPQGESVKVRVRPETAKALRSVVVVPSTGRDKHGQFRKGRSGSGVVREERQFDLAKLARLHAPEAVQVLVEVMGSKAAPPAARTAAANSLLDRGYGKPMMKVETTGGEDLRQLHLDALKAVAHAAATGGAAGAMAGAAMAAERVGAAAYFADRLAVVGEVVEAEVVAAEPEPAPVKWPGLALKAKRKRKPPPKAVGIARAAKARAGKAAKKAAAEASKVGAEANSGGGIPDRRAQQRQDDEAEAEADEGQEVEL